MELSYLKHLPQASGAGFNFDNCIRNKALTEGGVTKVAPKFMKTGTTICGAIWKVSLPS